MTQYLNPSTRNGGTDKIVIPDRALPGGEDEPPFDGKQYARVDGEWVEVVVPETPPPSTVGLVAEATITTSSTPTSSTSAVDVTGLEATFTAVAGRLYKVSWDLGVQSSVAGDRITITVRESTTAIGTTPNVITESTGQYSVSGFCITEPAAGSHTYKVAIHRANGTGSVNVYADTSGNTAYLLIEDIGAA